MWLAGNDAIEKRYIAPGERDRFLQSDVAELAEHSAAGFLSFIGDFGDVMQFLQGNLPGEEAQYTPFVLSFYAHDGKFYVSMLPESDEVFISEISEASLCRFSSLCVEHAKAFEIEAATAINFHLPIVAGGFEFGRNETDGCLTMEAIEVAPEAATASNSDRFFQLTEEQQRHPYDVLRLLTKPIGYSGLFGKK